ncbi:MAG: AraC family transcriptional regulator [Sphingobacteriales bacterium]|jgi:AraC-like DNA-binding protein|nr:AraC family transcriptional regulator [Sphingobacteriales bacterium]
MNQTIYRDVDNNAIRFSKIKKMEAETPFTGLGIKYVASGTEIYYANNKKYTVREGEYIIGNDFTTTTVQINHKEPVQGLCIDISAQIIAEVAEYNDLNGSELKEFLLSDQLLVNTYKVKNTGLGLALTGINRKIKSGSFTNDLQQSELFYTLAESIIADQRFVFDHFRKMGFKKSLTNAEVFRSILNAKCHIDEHVSENISLDGLSMKSGISKYHFIRLFKSTFGISPYQYQIRRKLEHARIELIKGVPVSDVALTYGYADAPAFSKAFRLAFGQSPGSIQKSNF